MLCAYLNDWRSTGALTIEEYIQRIAIRIACASISID